MTVYCVFYHSESFDETSLDKIFSSLSKAEDYVEIESTFYCGEFEIVEREVE